MSTLKSATVSGSPKGDRSPATGSGKSSHSQSNSSSGSGRDRDRERDRDKDRDRDRDRRISGSPKVKPSSLKLKPIDLNAGSCEDDQSQDGMRGGSSSSLKSGGGNGGGGSLVNKAKSSLSAVIDKLKSAQGPEDLSTGNSVDKQSRVNSSGYIIKPSSDGMKLTINKTKSKSSSDVGKSSSLSRSQSSSSIRVSGSGSSSGSSGKKSSSSSSGNSSSSSKSKLPFQKSSSSGSLSSPGYKSSSSSGSRSVSGESSKPISDKKQTTIPSSSSISTTSEGLAKTATPQDVLKFLGLPSSNSMDGFMKSLDKKFQIPKLSARGSDQEGTKRPAMAVNSAPTTPTTTSTPSLALNTGPVDAKSLTDFVTKEVSGKFPFPLNLDTKSSSGAGNRSSPQQTNNDTATGSTTITSVPPPGILRVLEKIAPVEMRPPLFSKDSSVLPSDGKVIPDTVGQSVLKPPSSPSVSVHIVKSPVPPSPHMSHTDDELMDEALMGISGK